MSWKSKIAVFVIGSSLMACNPEVPQEKKELVEIADEAPLKYASTRCLIEPELLLQNFDLYVHTTIVDLRKPAKYAEGHLEGAVNVWRNQITDSTYDYGGMMATKEQMESLLGSLGILPSDSIIIYDNRGDVDAARLWWILEYYGHKNTMLINGGLKSWEMIGGKITDVSPEIEAVEYRFVAGFNPEIKANVETVKTVMDDDGTVLLDTRTTEEFSGEKHKKGAAHAGAIPSAINRDWAYAVDYNGDQRFLSAQRLKEIYAEIGIDGSKPVVTYCHSGVRSAHTMFVLTQLLGYPDIRNYDGSWTEWSHLDGNEQ